MTGDAIWVNGERRTTEPAHVSARDRGFTLADGVFETMRLRNGSVFRLDRHLARLSGGLAALAIPEPPTLRDWVRLAAHEAPQGEASVRITVTRGIAAGGLLPAGGIAPTVVVLITAMPAFPAAIYDTGLTAHVASGRFNEHAMTAGLKTLAYTDAVMALLEARRAGADEALLLDTAGHCAEASASNVFAWTGETLLTPPLTCGVLPGITRAAVLELARAANLSVAETAFDLDALLGSEEAFLTSSLRGVAPLVRVGTRAIGGGRPGPRTRGLVDAYADLVATETSGMAGPA